MGNRIFHRHTESEVACRGQHIPRKIRYAGKWRDGRKYNGFLDDVGEERRGDVKFSVDFDQMHFMLTAKYCRLKWTEESLEKITSTIVFEGNCTRLYLARRRGPECAAAAATAPYNNRGKDVNDYNNYETCERDENEREIMQDGKKDRYLRGEKYTNDSLPNAANRSSYWRLRDGEGLQLLCRIRKIKVVSGSPHRHLFKIPGWLSTRKQTFELSVLKPEELDNLIKVALEMKGSGLDIDNRGERNRGKWRRLSSRSPLHYSSSGTKNATDIDSNIFGSGSGNERIVNRRWSHSYQQREKKGIEKEEKEEEKERIRRQQKQIQLLHANAPPVLRPIAKICLEYIGQHFMFTMGKFLPIHAAETLGICIEIFKTKPCFQCVLRAFLVLWDYAQRRQLVLLMIFLLIFFCVSLTFPAFFYPPSSPLVSRIHARRLQHSK
uniref:Uncharacterized protein n=1 Tax=Bigelowiella natans TaxID=227086 RepID=A0A7S2KJ02_BIGNA|mmetsp:Transcript_1708/g.2561  ORF Transcript_1708/g.2561 Transcript_1708/m.2561 type:complete len:437 (+) Transcript_1708:130-1440(+)